MATKIQQILEAAPNESVLFGSWLSSQGLDARGQYAYMKSGWLDRISKGVYFMNTSINLLQNTLFILPSQIFPSNNDDFYRNLVSNSYF